MSSSKKSGLAALRAAQQPTADKAKPPAEDRPETEPAATELPANKEFAVEEPAAEEPAADEPEAPPPACVACQVALPLGTVPREGYLSTHVDVKLNRSQALRMRQLCEGLQEQNARLENGRRVATTADVVRYVLEQLAPPALGTH